MKSTVAKFSRHLSVIALANGHGGRHLGCEHSIKALQASKILNSDRIPLHWREIIPETISGRQSQQLDGVIANSKNLCSAIQKACNEGIGIGEKEELLVFGGDHSCAIGTWSGVASSIRPYGDLGLIWIDAHLDSHTPETSPTGNLHGQPVSHLLGHGNLHLKTIGDKLPKLKPQNLVFVGIRSYEPEEKEFLQKLGVKIFYDDEILKRGINDVMTEAIDRVSFKTYGFGMSIDLDGFRITDAPAVGTPEEGGINAAEFLNFIQSHPMEKLLVTELVEFMPEKDDENKTSEKLIANLVEHIYLPRFSRYEIEEELKTRRQQRRA
jgi:arginase